MNKIFKVVFSKAKGMFVVADENAKKQGKSTNLKAVVGAVMVAGAMGLAGNAAGATTSTMIGNQADWDNADKTGTPTIHFHAQKTNDEKPEAAVNTNILITKTDVLNLNIESENTAKNYGAAFLKDGASITIGDSINRLGTVNFSNSTAKMIVKMIDNASLSVAAETINFSYSDRFYDSSFAAVFIGTDDEVVHPSKLNLSAKQITGTASVTDGAKKSEAFFKAVGRGTEINFGSAEEKDTDGSYYLDSLRLTAENVSSIFAAARRGGSINVYADNVYLENQTAGGAVLTTLNPNNTYKGTISIVGSEVTLKGDKPISISNPGNISLGKADEPIKNLSIISTAENGKAIDIWSDNKGETDQGIIDIHTNGTLKIVGDIDAATKVRPEGNRNATVAGYTININQGAADGGAVQIEGDIITGTTDGITIPDKDISQNLNVNISMTGSDSYLEGMVIDLNEKVGSESYGNGAGTNLSLSDGATWNVTGDSNVKNIESDNATINNTSDATINVSELKTEGETTYNTTSAKAGQLQIAEKTGDGQLTVALDNADKLASGSSAEAAKKLAAIANVDGGDNQAVTYTAGEGEVSGAMQVTTNEAGQVASVSEAKNEVMESLKDIGSNNFLGFRAQMNDLDKRMGDLRTMPNSDGAWARVIAGQSQYKSSHNTYQTLQVGADHRIGNLVLGATASYTDGDGKQKNGSTDDKTYSFGVYGSWLNDDGQFIDVIVKRYHAMSDYDLRYTNGTRAKGSLDTSGTSISAEYGWRLGIEGTNYYVEPQVEFMYGHMNSFGYKTSNGVKVKQDAIKTAVGRVGMAAGWVDPNKAGSAYFKVSVLNDWEGDSYSKATKGISSRKYHEDMGGTWVEYALGGTYNLSKNLSIYGEAETTSGNPVRTTYQVSAGMRYSF